MKQQCELEIARDPRKFDAHGNVIPYYGNTIICLMNDQHWPIGALVDELQEIITAARYSDKLAMLPLDSMHMTVISLLREVDRGAVNWPADIDALAPFTEIDQYLWHKFQDVAPFTGVEMVIEEVTITSLRLKAANAVHEKTLRAYRDQIAETMGIRHPDHDDYQFHVSMAYVCRDFSAADRAEAAAVCARLTQLAREKLPVFQLPAPCFTIFNDMLSYSTDLSDRDHL